MVPEDKEFLCAELLSLIAYGIKKETEKMPDIIWSANKTSFTYQGDTFSIPLFRSLVQNLIAKGERLLNDCLITAESDPFASLSVNEAQFLERIKENPAEGTNGYSFLSDHRNNWLQPLQQAVLEAILGSTKLKEKYLTCQKDVLLLLIHISGGQPARGPEILDLTLWNSPTRRRNLHVIDGSITGANGLLEVRSPSAL
ncbi:hypothetical protein L211DRAFT_852756 [Terfezia boudieri ATCC MYA-4762]|uniref:Uncharacterized protein n=1 Tax=Terfezia boudieri ATCC MYA-4762 TaxID=1051890 RepID=A0A3N4LPS0_9PEZI|nr:hypothetical protein L211DRAFT_852756 [Terfezia boudieri ATCC MYA-4762]